MDSKKWYTSKTILLAVLAGLGRLLITFGVTLPANYEESINTLLDILVAIGLVTARTGAGTTIDPGIK